MLLQDSDCKSLMERVISAPQSCQNLFLTIKKLKILILK